MIKEFGNYPGYGVHNGVDKVSEKLGQPYDATRAIRSQYLQRKSIRNHYKVKDKASLYHKQWKEGKTIGELALEIDFPPILLANFLMLKMRFSKKKTKEIMKNTNLVKNNKRLKEELDEVIGRDELYTPRSHDKQSAEGNRKEDSIAKWLDGKEQDPTFPHVQDLNSDGSSIFITSGKLKEIETLDPAADSKRWPPFAAQNPMSGDMITLNSDKLVFNAKGDGKGNNSDIHMFAARNINLASNYEINIGSGGLRGG
ncbi:MAG: hypothetical protein P8L43_04110, partial [Candidatus Marinimicrobia bacterium]|nr:hypothetical protein [Candidatus Neomarinimicrobiota bacterium]